MVLAAVDAVRVVEGIVGAALVVAALAVAIVALVRWRRQREQAPEVGEHALARFIDVTLTDPPTFGGGASAARIRRRRDTVTYGYLAVAEEHVSTDGGAPWCTLIVTLPGRVPFLVADNRAVIGRPHARLDAPHFAELDDPAFDATYAVGAEEPWLIPRVLAPAARAVLLTNPVQRLMLRETSVLLRTFDGVGLDDATIAWLDAVAEQFLSSTPSFITSTRAAAGNPTPPEHSDLPLPQGFYGPD
ncbi:MAG: hypothetical protein QOH52_1004 [Pseudonocardiales bacterium]|nr:hypothetical protein [Pseudonocardiales bacterium]